MKSKITVNTNDRVVAFDCDDTLVMWDGDEFQPHTGAIAFANPTSTLLSGTILKTENVYLVPHRKHIQKLKGYAKSGWFVIVWSAGGGNWANEIVNKLDLKKYVNLITAKPTILFDDLPLQDAIGRREYFMDKKLRR